jgi:DNA-binding transcriptional ArsR family regulator
MFAMRRSSAAVDVFHAIADANRRTLLDAIACGETPVGELTRVTGLSYSAVSQHLAILHEAGLVQRRKHGKQRLYRLESVPLREVHDWTGRYEQFCRDRLRRLKRVLGERQ